MNEIELLEYAYLSGGFTTRSDFARENAELVAYCALEGYLTTLTPRDGYGKVWRITASGLSFLHYETERNCGWQTLDS